MESIVYIATVNRGDKETEKTYVGLTGGQFKTRFTAHQASLRHKSKASSTALSKHIWSLKEKGIEYQIDWEIAASAPAYTPGLGRCLLCLREIYTIMYGGAGASLNSRSEISSTCRHRRKYLLNS